MTPRPNAARRNNARIAASVDAKGIYAIPVAARLLQEQPATIDRWAFGYRRRGTSYSPAISTDVPPVSGTRVITFLELVELMFIRALLSTGLSWHTVRDASRVAARLLEDEPHPFATQRWFADPAALYLRLGQQHDEEILIEVAGHAQVAMQPLLDPYLKQLDFDVHGIARRWFPHGFTTPVVVDPLRAFGMPVTEKGGVPTEVLAALHRAGDSIESIAAWYRIGEAEVEAAVAYEMSLSAVA